MWHDHAVRGSGRLAQVSGRMGAHKRWVVSFGVRRAWPDRQFEKVLVQPFLPDYDSLVASARERIAEGFEGIAPGVEP